MVCRRTVMLMTFKYVAHVHLQQSTSVERFLTAPVILQTGQGQINPRPSSVQQVDISINCQLLWYQSLASKSLRHGLPVISAFISMHICRCGCMSNERHHDVLLLFSNYARSTKRYQQPRTICLQWLLYTLDWTMAMQYWLASKLTWFAIYSRCSMWQHD